MADPTWHNLGSPDDFPPNEIRGAMLAGHRLCVGRAGDRYFAVDDTCPHAGGSLSEGFVEDKLLICPLHGFCFEIDTGHCPDDPSCSVTSYELRIHDGLLQIQL